MCSQIIILMKSRLFNLSEFKYLLSFCLLFMVYHSAEYMLLFKNSIVGFFIFQLIFFLLAFLLGNWTNGNGFYSWGLSLKQISFKHISLGLLSGLLLYAFSFFSSLGFGLEKITSYPDFYSGVKSSLPFAFGVLFTSFSEDILTRGLVYTGLKDKFGTIGLIFISATIYLLNHIYRLADGPVAWIYLFLLGIVFVIPVINTRSLWFTGAMHWAGNTFFYVSHSVIITETIAVKFSPNYLFAFCIALFIFPIWRLTKYYSLIESPK